MRDFRNAYHYRPDQDPPRQQFNGYVNFILNRDLYQELFSDINDNELSTRLSSQLRTADMPGLEFQTRTLNAYNRKKIVNTGVEHNPVTMKVVDSVSNSWLTILMKYYTYHYMNARNKQANTTDRDIDSMDNTRIGGADIQRSEFGGDRFKSNAYGYNTNYSAYFFERIDYVLYHGQRMVQYSLMNPVMTSFTHNQIDYSSNEPMEFDMTFEYENFVVYSELNEPMSEEDLDRFEDASRFTDETLNLAFQPGRKSIAGDREFTLREIVGSDEDQRERSQQLSQNLSFFDTNNPDNPALGLNSTYNSADSRFSAAPFSTQGAFGEFLGDIADRALSTAINGGNVGDAVLEGVIQGGVGVITGIRNQDDQNTRPLPDNNVGTDPFDGENPDDFGTTNPGNDFGTPIFRPQG